MIGELVVSELDGSGGIGKRSSLWCRLVAFKPRDLGNDRGYRVAEAATGGEIGMGWRGCSCKSGAGAPHSKWVVLVAE
jgi:hypothetical protein